MIIKRKSDKKNNILNILKKESFNIGSISTYILLTFITLTVLFIKSYYIIFVILLSIFLVIGILIKKSLTLDTIKKISFELLIYSLLLLFLAFTINMTISGNELLKNETNKYKISNINKIKETGYLWNKSDNVFIDYKGVEIDLEELAHRKYIEVGLSGKNCYFIIYFNNGRKMGEQIINVEFSDNLVKHIIYVPLEIYEQGYDTIKIYPLSGEGTYSLGYIKLLENKDIINKETNLPVEKLSINISNDDFHKLKLHREQALFDKILFKDVSDYVPATVNYQGKTYKIYIRLKGDCIDHLEKDFKWSFRIKVRGNNTLLGMKRFSIHTPSARMYLNEWLYHKSLLRENILALRYDFIKVFLNDRDLGIYAFEQHFEKRLLENNDYREGPILKFNEDLRWYNIVDFVPLVEKMGLSPTELGIGTDRITNIYPFSPNKILKNPVLYKQFITGYSLLESFRRGNIELSKAFDVDKLARFCAMVDLMGGAHNLYWHNLRFYYNPVTSLLEPIGFDAERDKPIENIVSIENESVKIQQTMVSRIFKDISFYEKYIKNLELFSDKLYLNEFLNSLNDQIEEKINVLKLEKPDYNYDRKILYLNQEVIKSRLDPVKGLYSYFDKISGNKIFININNILWTPVEILSLSYEDREIKIEKNLILPPEERYEPPKFTKIAFTLPENLEWTDDILNKLTINYKIPGSSNIKKENIFRDSYFSNLYFKEREFIKSNLSDFSFLVIDSENKLIIIRPGNQVIKKDLIIPEGYRVICNEGTNIDLINSSKIISYSPLEFIGSEDYPIKIYSSDKTGQGLTVFQNQDVTILKHVIFNNLSISFIEGSFKISSCQFQNISSKNILNIIHSNFNIENSLFQNNSSNSLNAVFSSGKISNTSFVNLDNGIYLYRSFLDIQNLFFNQCNKGIHCDEYTNVTFSDITMKKVETGVTITEMSDFNGSNLFLDEMGTGLVSYNKKEGLLSPGITINNLEIKKEKRKFLLGEEVYFKLDEEEIAIKIKEKDKLLLKKLKEKNM